MGEVAAREGPSRVCTSCGYDLTGAASGTCPECGYTPTPEEIALAERRAVFVELTRWRQWGVFVWPMAPFFLTYLTLRPGLSIIILGIALVIGVGWLAWAEMAGRIFLIVPRGQRRAARAVWRLSTKWLVMPFWASGIAIILVPFVSNYLHWSSYYYSYSDRFERVLFRAPVVVAGIAYAATWWVWRWSWRRLARAAGLTGDLQSDRGAASAARMVMWPAGIIIALPVLGITIELLLDWLNPQWWR